MSLCPSSGRARDDVTEEADNAICNPPAAPVERGMWLPWLHCRRTGLAVAPSAGLTRSQCRDLAQLESCLVYQQAAAMYKVSASTPSGVCWHADPRAQRSSYECRCLRGRGSGPLPARCAWPERWLPLIRLTHCTQLTMAVAASLCLAIPALCIW